MKKVMLIGYPMKPWREPTYQSGGAIFWPMMLDLELRLVELLKESGYEPVYKAHPDRIPEVRGIFEDKCEVIYQPFRTKWRDSSNLRRRWMAQIMAKMDILLFTTITTTAFSFALCTNRPIVALDLSFRQPFFPEPAELLKKRIKVVPAVYDERSRIIFDKEALLGKLNPHYMSGSDCEVLKNFFDGISRKEREYEKVR